MPELDITLLDLDDATVVGEWFALRERSFALDLPDDPAPDRDDVITSITHPRPGLVPEEWVALLDGHVVASMRLGFHTIENRHIAQVGGCVDPGHRRRGIGRALWNHALDRMRAKGCTVVQATAFVPAEGGADRDRNGSDFLTAMGAEVKLHEVRRRVELSTVDEEANGALLADAWNHAEGYELRRWVNFTPADLIDDVAYLDGRVLTDSPTGELDVEAFKVDAARVRDAEAAAAARRRVGIHVALVHAESGRVAAWSCLAHGADHKGFASHGVTIVDPDHRGRRLGTVVKLELHRYAKAVTPGLRVVDTYNAADNGHMIRINELVGFRPLDAVAEFQGDVKP
ncbi:GNAT family N-acetyltransferase [Phytomonospora endophytica]|uniref:GNAT superfamily N-acetyltransferase n=1 Tax=Phytomonospora endophytica TaxID=714109 RepID=A0A841G0A4_9ACTN|nr:GNAT family N-acetyltransferase [Phytomonospora endophytica]MBB6039378.1 GNAT superfamily N-acetyltransferase [Phytomonospora endophytica]GIG69679.1 GNAT family N-acetyltransferase [Phytomonospora endophytica]